MELNGNNSFIEEYIQKNIIEKTLKFQRYLPIIITENQIVMWKYQIYLYNLFRYSN